MFARPSSTWACMALRSPRGAEYVVDFLPKTKLEIAVTDDIAEQVIEAIVNVARTGKIGDGKIFVTQLDEVIRIRTGETGSEAV